MAPFIGGTSTQGAQNIEGGNPASLYLITQVVDGGGP